MSGTFDYNVVRRDRRQRSVIFKEGSFCDDGGEFTFRMRRRRDKVRGGDDFSKLGGRHFVFRVFGVIQ